MGEKRKEEDRLETTGPLGRPQGSNTELADVEAECQSTLRALEREGAAPDPFLLYLRGLALADLNRSEDAVQCMARSLQLYPCNWSCWHSLMVRVCACMNHTLHISLTSMLTLNTFRLIHTH